MDSTAHINPDMAGKITKTVDFLFKKSNSQDFFRLNIAKKPLCALTEVGAREQEKPLETKPALAVKPEFFKAELKETVKKEQAAQKSQNQAIMKKDPALLLSQGLKKATEKFVLPLVETQNFASLRKSAAPKVPAKSIEAVSVGKKIPAKKSAYQKSFSHEVETRLKRLSTYAVSLFKNGLRFAAVATTIFALGFLVLNFPAYSLLAKSWLTNVFTNSEEIKPAKVLRKPAEPSLPLNVLKNPEKLKHDIPALTVDPVPPDHRMIIPKIKINVPIVISNAFALQAKDWSALEKTILTDLEKGIVHYPGTSLPGDKGNGVYTGHSSYYAWAKGDYKTVFAPLHDLKIDDEIIIWRDQQKYTYKITEKKVVKPNAVEVMKQTDDDRITLITCTPVGTTLRRLVVVAKRM